MKLLQFLSNPLVQVFSFCIILVGSANFGGPYGLFLYHAGMEWHIYAVIGIISVVVTLISFFLQDRKRYMVQFGGAILMVISLLVFFFGSDNFMNMYAFRDAIPLLTLFLFIVIIILVSRRFFKVYN